MSNEIALTIGNEKVNIGSDSTIEALPPNRAMFVAIPPRYTNVDIRLSIDVIQGGVDLYISTVSENFVVEVNYTSGEHYLISPKEKSHNVSAGSNYDGIMQTQSSADGNVGSQRKRRSSALSTSPSTPTSVAYIDNVVHAQQNELSMYTEYKNGLLLIKGIRQRLILGIKHDFLDFKTDRFYVCVVTRGNSGSRDTAGYIYFMQDLPQIDLFVFFSVFFSVFFLILSFFFLSWKIKQLYHGRQAVIQQQIALETMASRPFANYTVNCERNDPITVYAKAHSELLEQCSGRNRKNNRRRQKTLFPMAVEFTDDEVAAVVTMFVQFPENEESSWNLSLGSAIVQTTPQQVVQTSSHGYDPSKFTTRFTTTVNT